MPAATDDHRRFEVTLKRLVADQIGFGVFSNEEKKSDLVQESVSCRSLQDASLLPVLKTSVSSWFAIDFYCRGEDFALGGWGTCTLPLR